MEAKIGETITFVNGMYSYTEIDDYIHQYIGKKGHKKAYETYNIT